MLAQYSFLSSSQIVLSKNESTKFELTQKNIPKIRAKKDKTAKLTAKKGNIIITKENKVLKIIKNFHLLTFIFTDNKFQTIAHNAEYKSTKDAFDFIIINVFSLYSTDA